METSKLQNSHLFRFGRFFSSRGRRTHPAPPKSAPVKVIGLDGRVTVYHRRVKAEELMKQHACHLLCRSDSFFIGQKLQALSAAEELRMGESYFVLPLQFFESVISFVTIASSIAKIGEKGGRSWLRHFDIQKMGDGKVRIRISGEAVEEEEMRKDGVLCTTEEMEKEYQKLVGSNGRQWRPNLEAIDESAEGKRRRGEVTFRDFRGWRKSMGSL